MTSFFNPAIALNHCYGHIYASLGARVSVTSSTNVELRFKNVEKFANAQAALSDAVAGAKLSMVYTGTAKSIPTVTAASVARFFTGVTDAHRVFANSAKDARRPMHAPRKPGPLFGSLNIITGNQSTALALREIVKGPIRVKGEVLRVNIASRAAAQVKPPAKFTPRGNRGD